MAIEEEQPLIPNLPEDIALDCLSRIPHQFLTRIRPVCKKWRDLLTSQSFLSHRNRIGTAEDLVFLVQTLKCNNNEKEIRSVNPVTADERKGEEGVVRDSRPLIYSLNLYNATLATWHRIPSLDSIPMFSQCAVIDHKLVLVGGWDPVTLDPVAETRILDLQTMTWLRGASMKSARSFFACAAFGGKVYVAGGHDGHKNALRSAEEYDVAADKWVSLPPMNEERDESKGVIVGGKFWAVSGYGTENQGRFATSAEVYDEDERAWTTVEGVWDDATCASCFGFEGRLWSVASRGVRGRGGEELGIVGPAMERMRGSTCGAVIGDGERVFVTAGGEVMEGNGRKWVRVEAGVGFDGFVYSAASVRI